MEPNERPQYPPREPRDESDDESARTRNLMTGFAFGIGSAAIVAALLYANRNKTAKKRIDPR